MSPSDYLKMYPASMKKALRAEMKRREGLFGRAEADAEAASIWAELESSPQFATAGTILSYMDIPGEVPTVPFMEKWRSRKRFAIPLVVGDEMEFYEYDPEHLREGYRGIMEPSPGSVRVMPSEVELALVPGVAFCILGGRVWRLGRGKGFYDRALPLMNCPKKGVFFSFRLVDSIPLDPWDSPLDF